MRTSLATLASRWIDLRNTSKPSPNTASARRLDLSAVGLELLRAKGQDCGDDDDRLRATLGALSPRDLDRLSIEEAFSRYAKTRAASTIRRTMSTWRQFGRWLVREGHLDSNPVEFLDSPSRAPWQPKPLAPEDLAAIAGVVGTDDPTARQPWPRRDLALFALFVTAGLRASEAINLKVGDAYLGTDPPRLRVEGKGNKTRTVVIPPETVDVVRAYLAERRQRHGTPEPTDALVVRADGRPCTRSAIDNLVRRWFARAGRRPPTGALAHSLRHTYATLGFDNGASLPEVQRLLGHADLSTTQAYLGVTGKGLEEAALANPARRLVAASGSRR